MSIPLPPSFWLRPSPPSRRSSPSLPSSSSAPGPPYSRSLPRWPIRRSAPRRAVQLVSSSSAVEQVVFTLSEKKVGAAAAHDHISSRVVHAPRKTVCLRIAQDDVSEIGPSHILDGIQGEHHRREGTLVAPTGRVRGEVDTNGTRSARTLSPIAVEPDAVDTTVAGHRLDGGLLGNAGVTGVETVGTVVPDEDVVAAPCPHALDVLENVRAEASFLGGSQTQVHGDVIAVAALTIRVQGRDVAHDVSARAALDGLVSRPTRQVVVVVSPLRRLAPSKSSSQSPPCPPKIWSRPSPPTCSRYPAPRTCGRGHRHRRAGPAIRSRSGGRPRRPRRRILRPCHRPECRHPHRRSGLAPGRRCRSTRPEWEWGHHRSDRYQAPIG